MFRLKETRALVREKYNITLAIVGFKQVVFGGKSLRVLGANV